VSLSGPPGTSWLRHRSAATAAALALIGGTAAAGATAAQASIAAPAGGSPGTTAAPAAGSPGKVVWARAVAGRAVRVPKPVFVPTPVRPEKVTHPRLDFMGSTVPDYLRAAVGPPVMPASSVPQLPGIDVSAYQGNINWSSVAPYIDFAYAKASEGTYYTNPYFYNQYVGPYSKGVIRGSYHFAIPNNSGGNTQADYFIAHGGGWSSDGKTLPGALDIEYNPYGQECYNLTQSQMVSWIANFVNEYAYREHAYPPIYSTTDWWSTCTGNYGGFGRNDPLWIANYSASHGGPLPRGWGFYTFWQYRNNGSLPGDQDVFNGAYNQLKTLATRG
jgi:GH25 family lysozyme M1 (1,4-beta-N-acetylmuramidase)